MFLNKNHIVLLVIPLLGLFAVSYRLYNAPSSLCDSLTNWVAQDENTQYINEWANLLFKNTDLFNEISNGQPNGTEQGSIKVELDLKKLNIHGAIYNGIDVLWTDAKLPRNNSNVAALVIRVGREGLIIHLGDYPPEIPSLFALFEKSTKASNKNVSVYCTSSTING